MPESYLRRSPLAERGLVGRARAESDGPAGVTMGERAFPVIVDLRAKPDNKTFLKAAEKKLGFALPLEANTAAGADDVSALWMAPDQWWVVAAEDSVQAGSLAASLAKLKAGVTEIGESRTCIRISGPKARALLAKGCPLDLHPSLFQAGQCARSLIGKVPIALHQMSDGPVYDIYVLRSYAEFLWLWLEDAAGEYGLEVVEA
ncbi:MAG: sarcosine oxidase subunit gamma family protein [Pseudomonadota bacterium]